MLPLLAFGEMPCQNHMVMENGVLPIGIATQWDPISGLWAMIQIQGAHLYMFKPKTVQDKGMDKYTKFGHGGFD